MNIDALKAELAAEHPDTGPYSPDDATAADQLNAVNRTRLRPLSMQELREWAGLGARGFKIFSAISDDTKSDQERNVAYIADKLMGTDDGSLNPGNALHVGMVDVLVSAGIISAADKTALVNKATDSISRAAELDLGRWGRSRGGAKVMAGHVEEARR